MSTETTTAVSNTVLGGAAISLGLTYAMNSSWGFSRSRTSVSLLVSGLFNNFAKLGLPVLALALLFDPRPSAGRVTAGLAGVAGLVAAVVLPVAAAAQPGERRPAGRVLGPGPRRSSGPSAGPPVHGWDLATTKFRDRTALLLHARWYWITLATLVSHLSLFPVLLLALRFVGVDSDQVTWPRQALAVFAFARLLTAIPFTPGGLGVVELALITGLAAAGGRARWSRRPC